MLQVDGLGISFPDDSGGQRTVVNDLSFQLPAGGSLALVGESGSGKSTVAAALLGLLPPGGRIDAGRLQFQDQDLRHCRPENWLRLRGRRIAMIFQDPMSSLNPLLRVRSQLCEHQRQHFGRSRQAALARAIQLLQQVGIPDAARRVHDYPHQFSGGQRQRIMIASALACDPDLLICDEPTTALDVTIQAEILDLLARLRRERQLALLFISHDLAVVQDMCEQVCVLEAGHCIEQGPIRELFRNPQHPGTRKLLAAVPRLPEETVDADS